MNNVSDVIAAWPMAEFMTNQQLKFERDDSLSSDEVLAWYAKAAAHFDLDSFNYALLRLQPTRFVIVFSNGTRMVAAAEDAVRVKHRGKFRRRFFVNDGSWPKLKHKAWLSSNNVGHVICINHQINKQLPRLPDPSLKGVYAAEADKVFDVEVEFI